MFPLFKFSKYFLLFWRSKAISNCSFYVMRTPTLIDWGHHLNVLTSHRLQTIPVCRCTIRPTSQILFVIRKQFTTLTPQNQNGYIASSIIF